MEDNEENSLTNILEPGTVMQIKPDSSGKSSLSVDQNSFTSFLKWFTTSSTLYSGIMATVMAVPFSMTYEQSAGAAWLGIFIALLITLSSGRSTLRHIEREQLRTETNNRSIFSGFDGILVMFLGVIAPFFGSLWCSIWAWLDGSPRLANALLSLLVPLAILLGWQELRGGATSWHTLRRIMLICAAIYCGFTLIALIANYSDDLTLQLQVFKAAPSAISLYLIARIGKRLLKTDCRLGIGSFTAIAIFIVALLTPVSGEIGQTLKVVAASSNIPAIKQIAQEMTRDSELQQFKENWLARAPGIRFERSDETIIQGVAGHPRIDRLASLEAGLIRVASLLEILAICWGCPMMLVGLIKSGHKGALGRALLGGSILIAGLCAPGFVDFLVEIARKVRIFN